MYTGNVGKPASTCMFMLTLFESRYMYMYTYIKEILAGNLPESSKILQLTFGNMPKNVIFKMHHAFSLIFHI